MMRCSAKVRLSLIKAGLITQLAITLNPLFLSFAEAVHIHTSLLSSITFSLWPATARGFEELEIEDGDEPQAVHGTVLQQVIVPLEKDRQEPMNVPDSFWLPLDHKRCVCVIIVGSEITTWLRLRERLGFSLVSLPPSTVASLSFATTFALSRFIRPSLSSTFREPTYTITKRVGMIPASSSSMSANDITITVAVWAFNLAANPHFTTSTTPAESSITPEPPIIQHDTPSSHLVFVRPRQIRPPISICCSCLQREGERVVRHRCGGGGEGCDDHCADLVRSSAWRQSEVCCCCWKRQSAYATHTFHVPQSSFGKKNQMLPKTKKELSWLTPLVACLLLALVLAIIIIVLLRRRQKKNAEPAPKEMEAQDPEEFDEKMEGLDVQWRVRSIACRESTSE
ncbi:hypothetical protein BLNAU_9830 [Blattamonas nauphoetae]|uniref:Uncharacterized protein n=1 Tax=Blattamonas nauphoetae TaxID=2049346 RepID=A0ABQ9XUX1_9EUKA|nr:hypothetical protein BLNAU_9830 [Blattamonas nauphoetae]